MMSIHIYSWIKYSNWNWIWILDFLMFFFVVCYIIIYDDDDEDYYFLAYGIFKHIPMFIITLFHWPFFLMPMRDVYEKFFFCFSPKICFNLIILEMEETNFSIFGQHFFFLMETKLFFPDPFNDFYRKRGWTTDELLNLFVCVCVVFEIQNENVMNKCNGNE